MGFDYITSVPLQSSRCGFFFMYLYVGHRSWQVPIFFINGCSAVSCDFGVFMRRGEVKALFHCLQSPILLIYFKVCKSVLLTIGTVLYNRSLLTYSSYITETLYPLRNNSLFTPPPTPQTHHSILYFYDVDYFYVKQLCISQPMFTFLTYLPVSEKKI